MINSRADRCDEPASSATDMNVRQASAAGLATAAMVAASRPNVVEAMAATTARRRASAAPKMRASVRRCSSNVVNRAISTVPAAPKASDSRGALPPSRQPRVTAANTVT